MASIYLPFAVEWKNHAQENRRNDFRAAREALTHTQTTRPLSDTLFSKYGAPGSTVTIVFFTIESDSTLQHLILVEDEMEQDTANHIYHMGRTVSKSVMSCIGDHSLSFVYQNRNCRIKHYFVGASMSARLEGHTRMQRFEQCPDGLIDVQIYNGKGLCREYGNMTERVIVHIWGARSDEPHFIEVYFCPICNEYYVNNDSYLRFCRKYGIPPFRLYSGNVSLRGYDRSSLDALNERSPLILYGYSVGKGNGMPRAQRQRLLEDLIDLGIMSKSKIISYLEFFIRVNGADCCKASAKAEWEADLEYIETYNRDAERIVWGKFVPGRGKIFIE